MEKTKIFLATTALPDFWDRSEKILFLSEACLRYDQKSEWEGLFFQILPYPWSDQERMASALEYCNQTYERMLKDLTVYLNKTHNTQHTERYWRIVIGEWLWRYIQIVFDRYTSLKEAIAKNPGLNTIVLDEHCYRLVKNNLEFSNHCTSDIYNLQLYSQILKSLGYQFPVKKCAGASATLENEIDSWIDPFKEMAKAAIQDLKMFSLRLSSPHVYFSGFPWSHKIQIQDLQGNKIQGANLDLGVEFISCEPDRSERSNLSQTKGQDEFETICYQLMEYCLPLAFLEGFQDLRKQIKRLGKKAPKIILSAVSWRFETLSAIYIAESVERGTRLIGIQHGGGYGTYAVDSMLDHELEVVDHFISWGWDDSNKKIIALPQPHLSEEKAKKNESAPSGILFVGCGNPRYLSNFQSSPWGSQVLEFLDWRRRFIQSLNSRVKSILLVRLYYLDFSWGNELRLKDHGQVLRYDRHDLSFIERAKRCKLVIADGNQTAYLQSLALDIPTVIFWDPKVWRIRKSAQIYFDLLKEAGVLFDSPEAAAFFINANYDDIEAWWNSDRVKEAVTNFRNHYASVSDKWEKYWENAIKRELVKS